jgi:4-hydroxy 2-oxovalerate aldolase
VSLQHFAAAREMGMETVGFLMMAHRIGPAELAAQARVMVDGALCALGAGAGNSPTEVLVATFERLGIPTGVDVQGALAAAEEVVKPFLHRLPFADRAAITQGYAGVYSSFLLHAERAAQRYGVPAHQILQRAGEAGYVGGQEDMIIDIALQLAAEQERGG